MTRRSAPETGTVAYVLKGFPRMSEIFIASEIARLEELGMSLRLYITKPGDGSTPHEVVGRIQAPRITIPGSTPSLSGTALRKWLKRSEEHTSELQSLRHLVCRLLLEKKKKNRIKTQETKSNHSVCDRSQ